MPIRTILFVSEAVTLAQVVRLVTLARALDPERYQIHFAAAHFDDLIFAGTTFQWHLIHSLSPRVVEARVAGGRRLYGQRTLARYVGEERALLAKLRPDLVVGDLRLSLSVSAALERVPYACLINAYWSPRVVRDGFPLPDHPIVRWLGIPLAARYFPKALPWVFQHFARPVNALRRRHGLTPLGSLPEVLTHGDFTLFADVPALIPTRDLPARQLYLGPVLWSPPVALPAWWGALDPGRPTLCRRGDLGDADGSDSRSSSRRNLDRGRRGLPAALRGRRLFRAGDVQPAARRVALAGRRIPRLRQEPPEADRPLRGRHLPGAPSNGGGGPSQHERRYGLSQGGVASPSPGWGDVILK